MPTHLLLLGLRNWTLPVTQSLGTQRGPPSSSSSLTWKLVGKAAPLAPPRPAEPGDSRAPPAGERLLFRSRVQFLDVPTSLPYSRRFEDSLTNLCLALPFVWVSIQYFKISQAAPPACGSSWARDRTCATVANCTTAVATQDPYPTVPQGNFLLYLLSSRGQVLWDKGDICHNSLKEVSCNS